ncbi:MAG: exonuclease domain-containing protein [Pseudomonadota bacterium]
MSDASARPIAPRVFGILLMPALALVFLAVLAFWIAMNGGALTPATRATLLLAPTLLALGLLLRAAFQLRDDLAAPLDALPKAIEGGASAVRALRRTGLATPLTARIGGLLQALEDSQRTPDADADPKGRLETLLRDLHDGVLLCTLDHHLLLYNRRALTLLHANGEVGLGRPLGGLVAMPPFRHTLHRLLRRFESERLTDHPDGAAASLVAATADGRHTLRGRMSLIFDETETRPAGYVVTFDDATNALSAALYHERALFDLTEVLRHRTTALRLAAETLAGNPGEATSRLCISGLAEETARLSEEIVRLNGLAKDSLSGGWPMSPVFSTTLFSCMAERDSEGRGLAFEVAGDPVWLRCDSLSITDLLERLANRIAVHTSTEAFEGMATRAGGERAYVDLTHDGPPIPIALLEAWLDEPLDPDHDAVTGRDVLHRHRTDIWSMPAGRGRGRLRLSLATTVDAYGAPSETVETAPEPEARAEFYDFDLLRQPVAEGVTDRPLRALTCVAFDTETTGLAPSKGDEIVSIAGVRIVNGRLLAGEIFNEFIDPGRPIPPASTRIHGITDAMVADAPRAEETLPRFRGFVGDAALIAHNAAFDMAFLHRDTDRTGAAFDGPVLDTLLLAATVLGPHDALDLDALALRFGVEIAESERHTALGDAVAAGRVFLALIPGLEERGIVTLGDAIAASERQVALRRMQKEF